MVVAISDLEGLSGAKSFETPPTPIVENQGVDKGLKSIMLALRRYHRGAKEVSAMAFSSNRQPLSHS
jgi:hypothetical protein